MLEFLSNVVAAFLGIMIAVALLAYTSADPMVKIGCEIQYSNTISTTACIITNTLNS